MTGRGSVSLRLDAGECEYALALLDEFIALISGSRGAHDPALERLTPNVRPDDDAAAAEFRRATRDDLLDRRLSDAREVRASLAAAHDDQPDAIDSPAVRTLTLDESAVSAWLRTLSAMRLVIASRLGIEREDAHDVEDPRFHVYDWLGYRLDQLVQLADESDLR